MDVIGSRSPLPIRKPFSSSFRELSEQSWEVAKRCACYLSRQGNEYKGITEHISERNPIKLHTLKCNKLQCKYMKITTLERNGLLALRCSSKRGLHLLCQRWEQQGVIPSTSSINSIIRCRYCSPDAPTCLARSSDTRRDPVSTAILL